MTKPIKISFLARAGDKLRLPKVPATKPIKIAFLITPAQKVRLAKVKAEYRGKL